MLANPDDKLPERPLPDREMFRIREELSQITPSQLQQLPLLGAQPMMDVQVTECVKARRASRSWSVQESAAPRRRENRSK